MRPARGTYDCVTICHLTVHPSPVTRLDAASGGASTDGAAAPIRAPGVDLGSPGLAAVYEEHFDLVWRTLRRYGVLEASIDDAVQDVFIIVHARLAQFEGRSSLRTWLFGIARRVARDHRPSTRTVAEGAAAFRLEALPDVTSKSPLATLEEVEGARLLERLLAGLAPKKREAFILVDLEEMTALEAGQALGVNVNTISARVRAAREELKEALARLEAHSDWRQRCATQD
jgi:RNA polymerase sigma-70 factor, ECF subfamily